MTNPHVEDGRQQQDTSNYQDIVTMLLENDTSLFSIGLSSDNLEEEMELKRKPPKPDCIDSNEASLTQ